MLAFFALFVKKYVIFRTRVRLGQGLHIIQNEKKMLNNYLPIGKGA